MAAKIYPDHYDDDESIRPDPEDGLPAEVRHEIDRRALDRITDKVLAYKPKPKTKAEKRRIRRRKREARKLAGLTPATA